MERIGDNTTEYEKILRIRKNPSESDRTLK